MKSSKTKNKAYLIPYYHDQDVDNVTAYLFLKSLVNPNCNFVRSIKGEFRVGNNKLWFAGGCPYPFGGNIDAIGSKSIATTLAQELNEESHSKIKLEDFEEDWGGWNNEKWQSHEYKSQGTHKYYILPLKHKITINITETNQAYDKDTELINKLQHMDIGLKESTGIIVVLELQSNDTKETILQKIDSNYSIGKKRFELDKHDQELNQSLSKFKEHQKVSDYFQEQYDKWDPVSEFEHSNTLDIISSLYGDITEETQNDV